MSRERPSPPRQRKPAGLPSEESTQSFWHTQPSPLLTGHRSTRNLPESADAVIIGSGISGASIAHHLLTSNSPSYRSSKRLNVVMLEAREACWGATGRNGGHCQPLLFEHPHDPSIGEFELANFHTLQNLIEKKNIDCEFVAQPGVRGIFSDHHLEETKRALETMETTAPELRKHMAFYTEKEQLAKLRLPTAKGAVVTDFAARMWPYKFVAHILENLLTSDPEKLNGTFNLQTLTPATSIDPSPNSPTHHQITTPRGTLTTPKLILATNAYTSHLLPHPFTPLIIPCRGQMSALQPLPSLSTPQNRLQSSFGFLGDGLDDYLIQRPSEKGGHLMFGGGRQHGPSIGVTDDSVLDPKTAAYLRRRLIPTLGLPDSAPEFQAANEWTGIMGFSRDDLPWVGAMPHHPGLYISAGFTGHGMPNTWLCGKTVALAVQKSFESADEEWIMEEAAAETALPRGYRITQARIERAMEMRDVEERDWAEMARGGFV
ncbi:DAO-domain-containing protein [Teratosphaeria nubilosa]|uniref:DAO-domain-containing protein n=1 Tax=Teratosphaeria nubilosa TaxID=161662 RepID=A0A6G1LER1_9PEZI|nr:DAO-domain-containing protein [Teratosphaeria nubilosa]